MARIRPQSRDVDVCVVELGDTVMIADVSRAEAQAIVAAYERVTAGSHAGPPPKAPRRRA